MSGSNIAIVSGILLGLFTRLFGRRKRVAVSVTIGGIILYTLLVGADAAVTRAALMGILFVIAIGLGRQSTAIISLFVAAMIMLLLNPLTLWDVGFQLSAMATLGLILFSKPLQRAWDARIGKRIPKVANNLLAEALLVTLAAQITTMPLVVYYFGRLSIISFLANFLIIPVQPPIMIAGGLAIFAGFILLPLAKLIALIPYASLWWTVFVVEKMAAVPWGSMEVSAFGRMLAALLYLRVWRGIPVVAFAAGARRDRLCARSVATTTHRQRHAGRVADFAVVDRRHLVGEPARWSAPHPTVGAGTGGDVSDHHARRQPHPARSGSRSDRLSAGRHSR